MSRNYSSPYAKPMQQYPSQSEDYISLEIGGPGKCSTPARPPQYNSLNGRGGGGNYFQQNRQQRVRGNQQNRFSGGNWQNNRNSFGGYGGQWQQQQQTPRSSGGNDWQRRGGGGGSNYKQRNNRQSFNNKDNNDLSSYVHPSMLEDPWKDLMERRDAIKRSEINLPTPTNGKEVNVDDETVASAAESSSDDDEMTGESCVEHENNELKSP